MFVTSAGWYDKREHNFMNLNFLEKLKKLAIIAMVSDDCLMERLVLKVCKV